MPPTAAYIGGPAEPAYFAQSQVLYERLLGHMPAPCIAKRALLCHSRAAKLMDRYKLRPRIFRGQEAVRERIASKTRTRGFDHALKEVTGVNRRSLDELQQAILSYDRDTGLSAGRRAARRWCTS